MAENLKNFRRGSLNIYIWTLGSVRGIKQSFMVEYCDTPHIEREEKQGIQSIPKEGRYDVYSTKEVMSKVPYLLSTSGYFPCIDHSVPPDVSFENYLYYLELVRKLAH